MALYSFFDVIGQRILGARRVWWEKCILWWTIIIKWTSQQTAYYVTWQHDDNFWRRHSVIYIQAENITEVFIFSSPMTSCLQMQSLQCVLFYSDSQHYQPEDKQLRRSCSAVLNIKVCGQTFGKQAPINWFQHEQTRLTNSLTHSLSISLTHKNSTKAHRHTHAHSQQVHVYVLVTQI